MLGLVGLGFGAISRHFCDTPWSKNIKVPKSGGHEHGRWYFYPNSHSLSFCSASHVLGLTERVFTRHSQGCHNASHSEGLTRSYGELWENNADMDTVTLIMTFLESSLLCWLIHFVLLPDKRRVLQGEKMVRSTQSRLHSVWR